MKRVLLAVLLLSVSAVAQMWPFPGPGAPTVAAPPACSGSDTFSGSGALGSCWTGPIASFASFTYSPVQSSGVAVHNAAWSGASALYSGATFSNDQYAEVTVPAIGSGGYAGICVRATTTGNGYCWGFAAATSVAVVTAGTGAYGGPCTAPTAGQTMRLGVHGSTITCYINGASVGSFTDSTWTSGSPAILITNGSGSGTSGVKLSNFSAGAN